MMDVVETWTCERSVAQAVPALEAAGVPCAAYADPGDALRDPHLLQRGLFSEVHDGAGSFTGANPPWQMSGTRAELRGQVPGIGEHTDAVLSDCLQLPATAVQRLREAGVFGRGRA